MAEQQHAEAAVAHERYLTFRVGRQLYALAAQTVAEVIRVPPIARVPHSPAALLGIGNLRGAVLPLVSVRGLLGLETAPDGNAALAVVLSGSAPVALTVDAIEGLVRVASGAVKTDQGDVSAVGQETLLGVFETPRGVAKILDIQALLHAAFAARASAQRQSRDAAAIVLRSAARRNSDTEMLVTFDVAGQEFALPIEVVREIVPPPDAVTTLPHSEDAALGLMVLREELLPLLSLRALLGLGVGVAAGGREKIVVARIGGQVVGLVADRARSIVAAERARIEAIPPVLAARTRGEARIASVYRAETGGKVISILAPQQLFREDVMQKLGANRQAEKTGDAQIEQGTKAELSFLAFKLGDDEFGLPIAVVDEVAIVPDKISKLPKTPKFLEGVVNLRGDVLPVVDQRRRFDMPKPENLERRRLIVIRTARHRAGLIVDSVSNILRARADEIGETPQLTDDMTRLVNGVVNHEKDGRIVLLLDPNELLTRAEQGLLDTFAQQAKSTAS